MNKPQFLRNMRRIYTFQYTCRKSRRFAFRKGCHLARKCTFDTQQSMVDLTISRRYQSHRAVNSAPPLPRILPRKTSFLLRRNRIRIVLLKVHTASASFPSHRKAFLPVSSHAGVQWTISDKDKIFRSLHPLHSLKVPDLTLWITRTT